MISNAIMLKIYDILVCNGTISDASLNEFGLTQFDIDTLIDEEYIDKVKKFPSLAIFSSDIRRKKLGGVV